MVHVPSTTRHIRSADHACRVRHRTRGGPGRGQESTSASAADDRSRARSHARLVADRRSARCGRTDVRRAPIDDGRPRRRRGSLRVRRPVPVMTSPMTHLDRGHRHAESGHAASSSASRWQRRAMRTILWYQRLVDSRPSPCRFSPTCSSYALEAFEVHGTRRGAWLTLRRLLRCRPLGPSGWDPVPERLNVPVDAVSEPDVLAAPDLLSERGC